LDDCLQILIDTNRLPEAAFFARTYMPSKVPEIVKLWKEGLSKSNEKAAQALAEPTSYENLFPGFKESIKVEQYLKETRVDDVSASEYPNVTVRRLF
jgi:coatomer subunit beta'